MNINVKFQFFIFMNFLVCNNYLGKRFIWKYPFPFLIFSMAGTAYSITAAGKTFIIQNGAAQHKQDSFVK